MTVVLVRGRQVELDYVADIEELGHSGRYRVVLDGDELVGSRGNASLDACRVLQARGLKGRIGFRHADGMIGLVTTIEAGARLAVKESGGRPRFVRWTGSG